MDKRISIVIILVSLCIVAFSQRYILESPNKQLSAKIHPKGHISLSLQHKDIHILEVSEIAMHLQNHLSFTGSNDVLQSERVHVSEIISSPLYVKSSVVKDEYNALTLDFKNDFSLEFRMYDDGFAYRFISTIDKDIIVESESLDIQVNENAYVYFPEESSLVSHYERQYAHQKVDSLQKNQFCSLPFLLEDNSGVKILFTESDLDNYPGLFMKKTAENTFSSLHPNYVLKAENISNNDRREKLEYTDFIAKTEGKRSFPWRVFIVGNEKDIVESNLAYLLASPSAIDNTDWINPGQVAWDWYNANNITGVNFRSGINTQTYKYYIDFAAANGIPYILIDEGWSKTTTNLSESRASINIQELVQYGASKGIGIFLWALWKPLDEDLSRLLALYNSWGIVGVKIDFMQRSDQYMVQYYKRVAIEAAKNQLMVNFHSAYKPTGLQREYPNVMTFEGVLGNELNKVNHMITPEHNVTIPFIRMVAGPMDYTPGAMRNAHLENHHPGFSRPMGLGTRCHEIAKYVVYESPLQMLCDAPSLYIQEQESTDFITQIPVVWDEIKVLDAKISDYIVIARRKGDDWYIAAMTGSMPRAFEIKLDFLVNGNYSAEIMEDGINADRNAEDYRHDKYIVTADKVLEAKLSKGGGWVAILRKL